MLCLAVVPVVVMTSLSQALRPLRLKSAQARARVGTAGTQFVEMFLPPKLLSSCLIGGRPCKEPPSRKKPCPCVCLHVALLRTQAVPALLVPRWHVSFPWVEENAEHQGPPRLSTCVQALLLLGAMPSLLRAHSQPRIPCGVRTA